MLQRYLLGSLENNKFEILWKEEVLFQYEVLFHNLPGRNAEITINLGQNIRFGDKD
jgi:hypothetical protein